MRRYLYTGITTLLLSELMDILIGDSCKEKYPNDMIH